MNKNYIYFVYKFMLVTILLSSTSVYPQCDITHTSTNPTNSYPNGPFLFAQSFVATCSGYMGYFELISSDVGTIPSGTLSIFNGNTVSGTPIYTQSYPEITITTTGDPITFNITADAPLVLNNQYTFEFTYDVVSFLFETFGTYTGGNAWQDGTDLTNVDIIFSVSISGSPLGISDFNKANGKKLYPNPSSAFINISGLTKVETHAIYNLLGEKIIKGRIFNNDKIDIQDIANGLYFVKFENGNILRFIKASE